MTVLLEAIEIIAEDVAAHRFTPTCVGNAVADSKQTVIGPFPKDVYNNANGIVQFSTSVVMSIIAFRV